MSEIEKIDVLLELYRDEILNNAKDKMTLKTLKVGCFIYLIYHKLHFIFRARTMQEIL